MTSLPRRAALALLATIVVCAGGPAAQAGFATYFLSVGNNVRTCQAIRDALVAQEPSVVLGAMTTDVHLSIPNGADGTTVMFNGSDNGQTFRADVTYGPTDSFVWRELTDSPLGVDMAAARAGNGVTVRVYQPDEVQDLTPFKDINNTPNIGDIWICADNTDTTLNGGPNCPIFGGALQNLCDAVGNDKAVTIHTPGGPTNADCHCPNVLSFQCDNHRVCNPALENCPKDEDGNLLVGEFCDPRPGQEESGLRCCGITPFSLFDADGNPLNTPGTRVGYNGALKRADRNPVFGSTGEVLSGESFTGTAQYQCDIVLSGFCCDINESTGQIVSCVPLQ